MSCNETGYRQQNKDGNNPDDKKAWIWVLVTPLVSVFTIALSRFVERMLTVNASLKSQGRSILDFLTESCLAAREGLQPPSLLPKSLNR
jgi:hypothetical protein